MIIKKGDFIRVTKTEPNKVCGVSSIEENKLWDENAEGLVLSNPSPDGTVNVIFFNGNYYTCEDYNRIWSVNIDVLSKVNHMSEKNGIIIDFNKNINIIKYILLKKYLERSTKKELNSKTKRRKYYIHINNSGNLEIRFCIKNINEDKYYYINRRKYFHLMVNYGYWTLYEVVKNKLNGR